MFLFASLLLLDAIIFTIVSINVQPPQISNVKARFPALDA